MAVLTQQLEKWTNKFGREYTKRNNYTVSGFDKAYVDNYGISRTALNKLFLARLPKSSRILEVGCNIGCQLMCLHQAGFRNLYAIEPQRGAVESARKRLSDAAIITGTAFDIPFKDGYFDLVYTSGVLIHIHPDDVRKAMAEIYRCSNKYIWGFEYYSKGYEEIRYRGHGNLLWKTDFAQLFLDSFPDLKLEKIKFVKYSGSDNVDAMYLLRKKNR